MQERSDSEGKRVSVHEKAGSAESDMGTAMRAKTKFNNNNTSGGPAGVVAPTLQRDNQNFSAASQHINEQQG